MTSWARRTRARRCGQGLTADGTDLEGMVALLGFDQALGASMTRCPRMPTGAIRRDLARRRRRSGEPSLGRCARLSRVF
jgi:hypothetical protein